MIRAVVDGIAPRLRASIRRSTPRSRRTAATWRAARRRGSSRRSTSCCGRERPRRPCACWRSGACSSRSPRRCRSARATPCGNRSRRSTAYRHRFEETPEALTNAMLLGTLLMPLGYDFRPPPVVLDADGRREEGTGAVTRPAAARATRRRAPPPHPQLPAPAHRPAPVAARARGP